MDYLKYYDLEKYLFEEVSSNFTEKAELSVGDFFCIVIWKANRSKSKIKKKLLAFGKLELVIKNLSFDISRTQNEELRLNLLIKKWGFGLPMATAILTVLYPEVFTVYDYRVREQLNLKKIYSSKKYFNYFLPAVLKYKKGNNFSLRDCDKTLWGKSFYEDLLKFIQ